MRRRAKYLMNEEGSALFIGIVMVVVLVALAGTYVTLSSSNYRNTLSRRESLQAYYVAEAGIEKALTDLNTVGAVTLVDGQAAVAGMLGGFSYSGLIEDLGNNTFRVTSEGEANGFRRRMETIIRKEQPPFLTYAVVTDGNLTTRGSIVIKGNVHSNLNIDLRTAGGGNAGIDGDVSAAGTIIRGTCQVTGDITDHVPPVDIPTIDINTLREAAIASGTYYNTSKKWATTKEKGKVTPGIGENVNGIIFVDGDLDLSGRVYGTGIIVASGNVHVTGNVSLGTDNSNVMLISGGDVFISGNTDVYAFIYTNGGVKLRGNADIYGSVVAKQGLADENAADGSIKGNVTLEYRALSSDIINRFAVYSAIVRRELPLLPVD